MQINKLLFIKKLKPLWRGKKIGVAKFYSDFIDELIIDSSEIKYMDKITKMGIKVHQTQILMKNSAKQKLGPPF